jgi:hypothetical protein
MTLQTEVDEEWMKFLTNQMTTLEFNVDKSNKENVKSVASPPLKLNETLLQTIPSIPSSQSVKPFDLIISTKTKVLFLNKPIDIFSIFWKIPIIEYWKPEKGVIKKQIKIVSKTKEELEIYKQRIIGINYYQEHIIKQIDNPTSRSIKFKDERKITIGMSKKDITIQRSRIKNAFYNCMAIILRFKFKNVFKEIHVKIFNTGKMEIPGIVDYSMLEYVKQMILEILLTYDDITSEPDGDSTKETKSETAFEHAEETAFEHAEETAFEHADETAIEDADETAIEDADETAFEHADETAFEHADETALETVIHHSNKINVPVCYVDNFKEEHVLINSNFNCGYFVNRERLYNILISPKYGLESSFDPCNYSGVKCRYYFNNEIGLNKELQRGVIIDDDKQMKLSVLMDCKKYTEVSLMIFRTGSCIIVGNCSEKILRFIFEFIKNILTVEYENICFNNEIPQIKTKTFKLIKRNINFA